MNPTRPIAGQETILAVVTGRFLPVTSVTIEMNSQQEKMITSVSNNMLTVDSYVDITITTKREPKLLLDADGQSMYLYTADAKFTTPDFSVLGFKYDGERWRIEGSGDSFERAKR